MVVLTRPSGPRGSKGVWPKMTKIESGWMGWVAGELVLVRRRFRFFFLAQSSPGPLPSITAATRSHYAVASRAVTDKMEPCKG